MIFVLLKTTELFVEWGSAMVVSYILIL